MFSLPPRPWKSLSVCGGEHTLRPSWQNVLRIQSKLVPKVALTMDAGHDRSLEFLSLWVSTWLLPRPQKSSCFYNLYSTHTFFPWVRLRYPNFPLEALRFSELTAPNFNIALITNTHLLLPSSVPTISPDTMGKVSPSLHQVAYGRSFSIVIQSNWCKPSPSVTWTQWSPSFSWVPRT